MNIHGIKNKLYNGSIFNKYIFDNQFNMIFLSELQTNNKNSKSLYNVNNYKAFHKSAVNKKFLERIVMNGGKIENFDNENRFDNCNNGGLGALIKKNNTLNMKILNNNDYDYILCTLIKFINIRIVVIGVYIPPYNKDDVPGSLLACEILSQLQILLDLYENLNYEYIIAGDFNAKIVELGNKDNNSFAETFINFINSNNLKVLNNFFTGAKNKNTFHGKTFNKNSGSIIDLALIKKKSILNKYIIDFQVDETFIVSDHYPIIITIELDDTELLDFNVFEKQFDVKLTEDDDIIENIVKDLDEKLKFDDTDFKTNDIYKIFNVTADSRMVAYLYTIMADLDGFSTKALAYKQVNHGFRTEKRRMEYFYNTFFYEIYDSIINCNGFNINYCCNKKTKKKKRSKNKWYDDPKLNEILDQINIKIENDDNDKHIEIKLLIKQYSERINIIRNNITKKHLNKLSVLNKIENPGSFYKNIKALDPSFEFPLSNEDGNLCLNNYEKTNAMMEHVNKISNINTNDGAEKIKNEFGKKVRDLYNESFNNTNNDRNRQMTDSEIDLILKGIDNNKAIFMDKLNWKFIKRLFNYNITLRRTMVAFIQYIFIDCVNIESKKIYKKPYYTRNIGIDKGKIPKNPGDLRYLRLKSPFWTIADKWMQIKMQDVFENSSTDYQLSYRKGFGVEDNLLTIRGILTNRQLVPHRRRLHIVFIDIKKAFDFTLLQVLLHDLFHLGLNDWRFRVLTTWFVSAKTIVTNAGIKSADITISQGVPQGFAISGPCFNTVIDKICKKLYDSFNIKLKIHQIIIILLAYADDVILLAENCFELQRILNSVNKLLNKSGHSISINKCSYTNINVSKRHQKSCKILLNGVEITKTNKFKYLGVEHHVVNGKLIYNNHIRYLYDKSKKIYNLLCFRGIWGNNLDISKQIDLVDVLFRPVIENGLRIYKFDDNLIDILDQAYAKPLNKIIGLAYTSSAKTILLLLGKQTMKVRNDMSPLLSYRRLILNPNRIDNKILINEYNYIKKKLDEKINIENIKYYNIQSYVMDCYKVFKKYNIIKYFFKENINIIKKFNHQKLIKYNLYKKVFLENLNSLKDNNNQILYESIISIINEIKHKGFEDINDDIILTIKPKDYGFKYVDDLYYRPLIYKLIGITKDDYLRKHHKFILSLYTKSNRLCWKVNNNRIISNCQLCNSKINDNGVLYHLIKSCKNNYINRKMDRIKSNFFEKNKILYKYKFNRIKLSIIFNLYEKLKKEKNNIN